MVETRSQRKRQRKDDSQIQDRISDLTDCLLIHILSFLNAREAVQTCILSKRWINVWKTLSNITISGSQFSSLNSFEQFLSMFFSLRDHSTDIHAFILHNAHLITPPQYRNVIEYAFSHNIQHFQINYCSVQYLPSCFFSSHTLTSLTLTGHNLMWQPDRKQIFPGSHSFNFPALTTLSLQHLSFCCNDDGCFDPFSTFNMLNTLIIDRCVLMGNTYKEKHLRISSTKLVNLTIRLYDHIHARATHATIDFKIYFGIELHAPTLHTLVIAAGEYIPKLFGSKTIFSSIKHLIIHIGACYHFQGNNKTLFNLLLELDNIESLTITSRALKVLSVFPYLFKVEFPSLCNLKLLNIKAYRRSDIPAKMVDFLLQNSPSAKVGFIQRD